MDKKEIRKIVSGVIFTLLIIAAAVFGMVWMLTTGVEALSLSQGSATYNDFMSAMLFGYIQNAAGQQQSWFLYGGSILLDAGAALFVVSLILIIVKRSIRFIFLPIAGLCAFVCSAFLLQGVYESLFGAASTVVTPFFTYTLLAATAALGVLGLIVFIFGLVFPRRLAQKKDDVEAAPEAEEEPVAEEAAPAEEPAPEEEPEPVEEAEPEEEPVAEEAAPVAEEEAEPEAVEVPEEEPKEEPKEEAAPAEEPAPVEEAPAEEPVPVEEPKEEPKEEKVEEPKAEEPKEEAAPQEEPEAAPAKKAAPKTVPLTNKTAKAVGKYEVFPEAGFYKYRLKANNGEILIVSNPYRTKESAAAGIETLKKNIALGNNKIIVDKNKFAQFRIFTANDSRLVVAGEIYPNAAGAERALNSAMKFYETDRVVTLDEIPENEHREWNAYPDKVAPTANGKLAIEENEEGKFTVSLRANNGQLLFITSTYASKASAKKAVANITEKLLAGKNLTIAKDKQDRYQFLLYSDNGMCLLMGESYPKRESAESALRSARNFIGDAKLVD